MHTGPWRDTGTARSLVLNGTLGRGRTLVPSTYWDRMHIGPERYTGTGRTLVQMSAPPTESGDPAEVTVSYSHYIQKICTPSVIG